MSAVYIFKFSEKGKWQHTTKQQAQDSLSTHSSLGEHLANNYPLCKYSNAWLKTFIHSNVQKQSWTFLSKSHPGKRSVSSPTSLNSSFICSLPFLEGRKLSLFSYFPYWCLLFKFCHHYVPHKYCLEGRYWAKVGKTSSQLQFIRKQSFLQTWSKSSGSVIQLVSIST